MKTNRIAFLLLIAIAVCFAGCEEFLSDLLRFNSDWYSIEFSIDSADQAGNITFTTDTVPADLDSLLEANGLALEAIESIKICDAKIYIMTNGITFDPVTSVEFLIETDLLPEQRIAWLDTIPGGVTMIELNLIEDDLKGYVLEDRFIFTAKGHLESRVDQEVDMILVDNAEV